MRNLKIGFLSILAVSLMLVSCGKKIEESTVLVEYLESADSPIDVNGIAKYVKAVDLQPLVLAGTAYVIDVRSADDYSTVGHISGGVNVAAGEVLTHLKNNESAFEGKKLVIACYTGQTAAYVTSLVRMAGYDAYSLLWGMSSWNADCAGSLNTNSTNTYATEISGDQTDYPMAEEGALPVLETGFETAEDILAARIDEVLAAGFSEGATTAANVFGALDNYYIINYWSDTDYALGHIPGAIQYTPNESLVSGVSLKTLPTDKQVVVYCYTGQTSAFTAAYLRVLGYDAKSLKFGVNGMAHDWAASNGLTAWGEAHIAGYDLVTGANPTAE